MDEWSVYLRVAVATALAARRQEVARLALSGDVLRESTMKAISAARAATDLLMRENLIRR